MNRVTTKSLTLLFTITCLFSEGFAQIPNPSFESWKYSWWNGGLFQDSIFYPSDWTTNSSLPYSYTVDRVSIPHSGSYALWGGVQWERSILNGAHISCNFSIDYRPSEFTGFYKFSPAGGDSFFVKINMSHTGSTIGGGETIISKETSGYTQFTVSLNYSTSDIPDKCSIEVYIQNKKAQYGSFTNGSYFLLGDLEFSKPNSITQSNENIIESYKLFQNYPNPFNPSTNISFSLASKTYVELDIFNLIGMKICTLVAGELSEGFHVYQWNADKLPAGIYFCSLNAGSFKQSKKLILLK